MANVLEKIVADKREEIAARKTALPLESFKDALVPSQKVCLRHLASLTLASFLNAKSVAFKGLIRDNFDLDEILAAYTPMLPVFLY